MSATSYPHRLGWIGTGRMGYALVVRLLEAGCDVRVWNRTRSKAEPLSDLGAAVVDSPADLADRDIVVTMLSSSDVFTDVVLGEGGLLSRQGTSPRLLIDSSTVSVEAYERVREEAAKRGTAFLAAPVSGNPKVVRSGRLGVVASGPREAFDLGRPYLELFGSTLTYVGENDAAGLVKVCHNLILGVVTQVLAETTVLAERAGVSRADYLDFINGSVMGSVFTRYKAPAFVRLDYSPTFTGHLLRKDFELGLAAGREHGVPLPVSSLVHQLVTDMIGNGLGDQDFAALLERAARGAGLRLEPEDREVSDGLAPIDDATTSSR